MRRPWPIREPMHVKTFAPYPFVLVMLPALLWLPVNKAAAQDSLRTPQNVQEVAAGYDTLMRQYAQLRRVAEAGVVGGDQDGLQRIEIDGLVVDETQTRLGGDFYALFHASWIAPEGAVNFTIVVREQPLPNIGTRILVHVKTFAPYPFVLVMLAVLLWLPVNKAAAQDSLRTPQNVQEVAAGYDTLMRQYAQLRRVAEAGVVGGDQDGLQRIEIDGLVVDETQTRLGGDFYALFHASWIAPEGAVNFTIVVREQPLPNIGTRILVHVNDEVAFQTQLQPREEMVEAAAQQGLFYTHRFVQGLSAREEYVY